MFNHFLSAYFHCLRKGTIQIKKNLFIFIYPICVPNINLKSIILSV